MTGDRYFLMVMCNEVIGSQDPRIKKILEWAYLIEKAVNSCKGVVKEQNNQAAIVAGELSLQTNYLELTRASRDPQIVITLFNRFDNLVPMFFYRADFEKRVITIDTAVFDIITNKKDPKARIEVPPLELSMRDVSETPESGNSSQIVMPT